MFVHLCNYDSCVFFFFNVTAATEIYTLSLHDALPICTDVAGARARALVIGDPAMPEVRSYSGHRGIADEDRKSTRLNSSHSQISYAVFCLKKKTTKSLLNTAPTTRST